MKSITKAVFVLTIFSVISKLLGFAFRIFLSHSIGEQGMAIYQIASGMGEAGNKVAFQLDWYNVLVCFWGLADMLAWVLFLIIKGAQKLSNFCVM